MRKKFNPSAGLIVLFVIVTVLYIFKTHQAASNNKLVKLAARPFHTSAGWGYEVLVDNKSFIHQQFIPAITGKQGFLKEEDAIKTGNAVIEKIKNKLRPTITKSDLASLGISIDSL